MVAFSYPSRSGVLSDDHIKKAFPEDRRVSFLIHERLDALGARTKKGKRSGRAPVPAINDLSILGRMTGTPLPELVGTYRHAVDVARHEVVEQRQKRAREADRDRYYYREQGEHVDQRARTDAPDYLPPIRYTPEWARWSETQYPQVQLGNAAYNYPAGGYGGIRVDNARYYAGQTAGAA